MGRSLDDLLPENPKHIKDGILPTITAAKGLPILVLFADVFDQDSEYRREAGDRAKDLASSLYGRTRRSIRQLLELAEELDYHLQLAIRVTKDGPPFALVMNEQNAIVEPYLPYLEGGSGLIYETRSIVSTEAGSSTLHNAHKLSFGKMWTNSRYLDDAIREFVARKPNEPETVKRYGHYEEIARGLRAHEGTVVTRSGLY
jgi:hypothetical protein